MKGYIDAEQLKTMKREELQALAKDMGVSAGGKNEEIIARIVAVEVGVPEESTILVEEKETADRQQEGKEAADGQVAEVAEDTEGEPQASQETAKKDALQETATEKAQDEVGKATNRVMVKAVTRFLDKQLNRIKDAGETYQVNRERAAELVAAGVAEIVG